MGVSLSLARHQWPVIAAMGRAALHSLRSPSSAALPVLPGPWLFAEAPPTAPDLLRAYVRHVGGEPSWYRHTLPAHSFPRWTFPLAAELMRELPFPLTRVINAGCRLEMNAALPLDRPLQVRARLESIEQDDRRALITQRFVTGFEGSPDALVADLRTYVPLKPPKSDGSSQGGAAPRGASAAQAQASRASVPADAHELAFLRLSADAGLDFAKLTGDFNPIHWVPVAARAAGFRGCILHGFSTLARAMEAVHRGVLSGDPARLHAVDVRFMRPLVLPARVGIFTTARHELFVGDAPSGGAYLTGTFSLEPNA